MQIKPVTESDAAELLSIYAPYVEKTAITFEYTVPSLDEFQSRIRNITAILPYIKAEDEDGRILGYAYAGRFHPRKAYEWSVETTVYVRENCRGKGIGQALYKDLECRLKRMGILNLNACIAVPRGEDIHLTMDSPRFHEKLGFSLVGTFHNSGYKFSTWYDMIWMEKMIGTHEKNTAPVKYGEWK